MKIKANQLIVVVASILACQISFASSQVSREQVEDELLEAQRTGNIIASETGQKLNEIAPGNYRRVRQANGVTRAQVEAELAEAKRTGDLIANDAGQKFNEITPARYN